VSGDLRRRAIWLVAALAFGAGCLRAWQLGWICDDAFISLRYAQNLVAGHGLVFNPGEYVEGYTNLSWTLLLAGALALGLRDLASAEALGLVCYAVLALLCFDHARRHARASGRLPLPLAGIAVLSMDDFHVWATGGLETGLFTLLAAAALLQLERRERPRRGLEAGLLFAAVALTRPDGALLGAVGAASELARAPRSRAAWMSTALVAAPLALTLVLWGAWKVHYYGELFPTAFYSKSALGAWWSQGGLYLALFLKKNWALGIAAVAAIAGLMLALRNGARASVEIATLLAGALVFALYVVRVGGDFMFARRLLPAVPLVLLALEKSLSLISRERIRFAALGALAVGLLSPGEVYGPGEPRIRGIADERRFYPASTVALRKRQGEAIGRVLAGSDARVAFEGGLCMLAYYSRLPYLAEITGLTHYSLAKRPISQRSFVGHEKAADAQWFSENEIDLLIRARSPLNDGLPRKPDEIYFEGVTRATILRWRESLLRPLATRPGVALTPIEDAIANTRSRIEAAPSRALAESILAELESYAGRVPTPEASVALAELRALAVAKSR
jgi:arabinofuranosyltransferase